MWGLWLTKWRWGKFSPSTSVSPANHSTNFSIIIITRGWHNRPISGRSAEFIQLDVDIGSEFAWEPRPRSLASEAWPPEPRTELLSLFFIAKCPSFTCMACISLRGVQKISLIFPIPITIISVPRSRKCGSIHPLLRTP
jgi:hypothetical protein